MTTFNPQVWGPHYWFFLHTIALTYPHYPNTIIKKRYYELLTNFDIFLPDGNYSAYYRGLLKQYPLTPFLDNRKSLVKWMNFIHNKVNKKLEKPQVSLAEFYKLYTQKQDFLIEWKVYYKKLYFVAVISILIVIIIYLYYK
jgi:Erv1 / Alr family